MTLRRLLIIPAAIVAAFLLTWLAGDRDSRAGWVARGVVLAVGVGVELVVRVIRGEW